MHGRLPPLTALRAFEAAARHLSFARAAEELHVTPAALSYQIRTLEDHLGMPVFRRLNRAVELTEAGRALAPRASQGFAALQEGVRAVERLREGAALTITAGPAFTAKWLAPRFFRFAQAHPEIELRFVASLRLLDFDRDGVDAAIRFGLDAPAGLYAETLIDEFVVPVAAPEVARRIHGPEDVARAPLFHDDSIAFLLPSLGWPAWFEAAGLGARPEAMRGSRFSNADHAIDGAMEGDGLALARASLAERDLAAGRLEAPLSLALALPGRFRFVCKPGAEHDPRIRTFLDWMREETRSLQHLAERFEIRPLPGERIAPP
ncbi:MAG: transcriptional regulator GcvA [Paracoccaceae bacterium]